MLNLKPLSVPTAQYRQWQQGNVCSALKRMAVFLNAMPGYAITVPQFFFYQDLMKKKFQLLNGKRVKLLEGKPCHRLPCGQPLVLYL
jgi:hypothetical protein